MIKPCKGNLPGLLIKPCPKGPEKRKDSPSECSRSTAESSDDSLGKTADYGVILVKNKKKQPQLPPSRLRNVHRGYNSKHRNKTREMLKEAEEESFVDFLSEALCGACISTSGGEEKALSQVEDNDIIDVSPRMATNIYIQRFQKLKMRERLELEKHRQAESLVTDVSFLTDPSLNEIEVNEHILQHLMPTKPSHKPKKLPAFRKLQAIKKSKRKQRGKKEEKQQQKQQDPPNPAVSFSVLSPGASTMPPPPPPPLPAGCACIHANCTHQQQKRGKSMAAALVSERRSMRRRSDQKKKEKRLRSGKNPIARDWFKANSW